MDTTSLLIDDVALSIKRAYQIDLASAARADVRRHLAFTRARLEPPNSLIEPVTFALKRLDDEVALDVQRSVRLAAWAAAAAAGAAALVAAVPLVQALTAHFHN